MRTSKLQRSLFLGIIFAISLQCSGCGFFKGVGHVLQRTGQGVEEAATTGQQDQAREKKK